MKKTISALLVCALLFALSIPAFAAGLNEVEKELVNYAKTAYTTADGIIQVPADVYTAATNYFNRDGVDLTQDQSDKLKVVFNEALAYLKANKIQDYKKDVLDKADVQTALFGYADRVCAILNLKYTVDRAKNTITIFDADGNQVASFKPGSLIVQTGADNTAIGAAFATVMLIACAGAFGVKRFRKEDDEA